MISIIPLEGIGKITEGDNLADLLCEKLKEYFPLDNTDCLVVTSKAISKSRGRIEHIDANNTKADAIIRESKRILRKQPDLTVTETKHGFICVDAGVDEHNCEAGELTLLPKDVDSAAHGLRMAILSSTGFDVSVIVSSGFSRPFREGKTNVALGISGMKSRIKLGGKSDFFGQLISRGSVSIADEIAGAAELVMHKGSGNCAALVRGLPPTYKGDGNGAEIIRNQTKELFQ